MHPSFRSLKVHIFEDSAPGERQSGKTIEVRSTSEMRIVPSYALLLSTTAIGYSTELPRCRDA